MNRQRIEQLAYTVKKEFPPNEGWIEISLPEDIVVARAHLRRDGRCSIVKFITVDKKYRNQGIARQFIKILKDTSDRIIAQGVRYNARGFWNKMGFRKNEKNFIWEPTLKKNTAHILYRTGRKGLL